MMRQILLVLLLTLGLFSAKAANYNDPGGVGDFTGGNTDLDISSVTVNNDATTVTFTINLGGNPMNNNWYNYYIGISRNLYGGNGGNLNGPGGWGKNIQMSTGGMDYFVGSYPSFAGYSLLTWSGSAWNTTSGTASQNSSSVTIPVSLSALGLSAGNSFTFDVWSSDTGADTVLDALSSGTPTTWNGTAFDTGASALSYTVQAVPEPACAALLVLGGLVLLRRSKGNRT
jgi:hypothetical protein